MANEAVLGLMWLNTILSNDSTLTTGAPGGIRRAMAPPDTATPFVIISVQSPIDITSMNKFRLMTEILYQVKAVGPASATIAIAAASACAQSQGYSKDDLTCSHRVSSKVVSILSVC